MATALNLGPRTIALEPAKGLGLLAQAEDQRSALFEAVLLLGDAETIKAARQWQRTVWDLQRFVKGTELASKGDFLAVYKDCGDARGSFYEAARRSLEVHGVLPETEPFTWSSESAIDQSAAGDNAQ